MVKRGRVTGDGDSQIVADGGSPEWQAAAWWNALSVADRRSMGRTVCRRLWREYDWDGEWEDLSPIGQQMFLHMHYDGAIIKEV
jgi:hypothetical protein